MPATPLTQAAMDYQRIEKAIIYLQTHFLEQPDLKAVAQAIHLSEYHFQRLFTRWVGISPKRFLQYLTVEHAKRRLAESKPVLDVALDSGLSSAGRLHDLFVSAEAVTPGEFKTRGAGVHIDYGFHATPFGTCLLGVTQRGACWLSFVDGAGKGGALSEFRAQWSGASFEERPSTTALVAAQIFANASPDHQDSLRLLLMGTNFQLKVWNALLKMPPGTVISYEELGRYIGAPDASRAIGSAVGRNRVAFLIPCHRVIRKTGVTGGYHWGEPRKLAMLAWEAARTAA
jgi:AraC family transcriptional regulator of adaptative response/methylated-DNA-[protein]-cysteine methyltransferase